MVALPHPMLLNIHFFPHLILPMVIYAAYASSESEC